MGPESCWGLLGSAMGVTGYDMCRQVETSTAGQIWESSSWCIGILVWRRFSENEYANPHGRGESEAGELDASDLLTLAPNPPLAREAD